VIRHYLVRSLLLYLAGRAGYMGTFGLTLQRTRFEAEQARQKDATRVDENDYGAMLPGPTPLVWINPATNTGMVRLAKTCAHEAVHLALPEHPHGPAFDHKVSRLLRGGAL